jgi:hypothetical protein
MKATQILSILFILLMSFTSNAQNASPQKNLNKNAYQGIVQKEVGGMKEKLKLTDSQVKELETAENRLYSEFFAPARDSASVTARKEKIDKLQHDKEEAFKKILTPDQWNVYMAHMAQQSQRSQEAIQERQRKLQAKAESKG